MYSYLHSRLARETNQVMYWTHDEAVPSHHAHTLATIQDLYQAFVLSKYTRKSYFTLNQDSRGLLLSSL